MELYIGGSLCVNPRHRANEGDYIMTRQYSIKHIILDLSTQEEDLDKIISDEKHSIKHMDFSSVVVEGKVKHFVLVIWHDEEYGDHMF